VSDALLLADLQRTLNEADPCGVIWIDRALVERVVFALAERIPRERDAEET
jgi:hypothetical protein